MGSYNLVRNTLVISLIFGFCTYVSGLKVTLFYEALCPDSLRFIGEQLYPNLDKIEHYVDELEFVPYGKAIHTLHPANNTTNRPAYYEFACQHGRRECIGNKYQACALSQKKGIRLDTSLVYCVMKSRNPASYAVVEECARRLHFDTSKLKSCAESIEADRLLAMMGDKTWQVVPNVAFIPTIVFNDTYDETNQKDALEDFIATVRRKSDAKI